MVAEEGFEPSQTESESVVLPLHYSAKYAVVISKKFRLHLQSKLFEMVQVVGLEPTRPVAATPSR